MSWSSTARKLPPPARVVFLAGSIVVTVALAVCPARATPSAAETPLAKRPLPAILTEVESAAEDTVDFALDRDRGNVATTSARLRTDVNGQAAGVLLRAGVPPTQVARLGERANRVARLGRRGSLIAVALAANAVSQLMPDLYARFRNRVPARVLALDYLDREAQLRSLARQPDRVATAVSQLGPTWARVRPKVLRAGGTREAAAYGRHVAVMRRLDPRAAKRVQAEAVRGLNLVDELENVFVR